jgi:apoptosis-inducing factor 2
LAHDFDVTLIDTKDYFEFTPSVLRTLVEPQHTDAIQVLHRQYLPRNVEVVQGEVTTIKPNAVSLRDRVDDMSYDVLVMCAGSRYEQPFKEANAVRTHT